ncbi:MAG: arylesterase [Cytophagia bacterium]|nr:arylesterase [Cytophagia bacterium]NBW34317.1 arylesterase [Cytophagia bacterium]
MVAKTLFFIASILLLQGTTQTKTILFFGDSLTAGYGLSTEEAFPALTEKLLNAKSKQCKVINAGLSGETSAGGVARIDWILRQPVDIFILELGANDGLRGLPLDQTEKNLQIIIDKVKMKYPKVKVLLAGMMVPPNMGKEYSTGFQAIYPRLAKKNKATLIPFLLEGVAGKEKLNLPDGIHPNPEGHKIVANTITNVLKPMLN